MVTDGKNYLVKECVAISMKSDKIEIWGDGNQLRSFTYIDDCIEGTLRLMQSEYSSPLNIGSAQTVSIKELYSLVCQVANLSEFSDLYTYRLDAPQGVRARTSDNTLCERILNWSPNTELFKGLSVTYQWVSSQL